MFSVAWFQKERESRAAWVNRHQRKTKRLLAWVLTLDLWAAWLLWRTLRLLPRASLVVWLKVLATPHRSVMLLLWFPLAMIAGSTVILFLLLHSRRTLKGMLPTAESLDERERLLLGGDRARLDVMREIEELERLARL
jgi:hypothetical protein